MIRATLVCSTSRGARTSIDLATLLDAPRREEVHEETYQWIKQLRCVRYGTDSMRERFTYDGDSLWWFTEIYLHKTKRLERAVATVLALEHALERFAPADLELATAEATVAEAARRFAQARHLPLTCTATHGRSRAAVRWSSFWTAMASQLSRVRRGAAFSPGPRARVAAFVHNAFWRTGSGDAAAGEAYIGPVLEALGAMLEPGELALVGVGPRRNFRARRWWDPLTHGAAPGPLVIPIERLAPRAALTRSTTLWRDRHALASTVVSGEAIRAAGVRRGIDLWPILRGELIETARLQWPWAARAMDEAGASLDRLRPDAVVTYAEAGGWGRALVVEARRRGIPSGGLQHGFIYRHWLNYRHEPDELRPIGTDAGCPIPDRTLVFDGGAERQLLDGGRFPAGRLAVVGSPRLDELAARVRTLERQRSKLRTSLGVQPDQQLAVLAAKFVEVHGELPSLGEAIRHLPQTRLIVKTHPAETTAAYAGLTAASARVTVAPPDADLATLIVSADVIVTMNSTVAVDAMVLGIPTVVLGLPNNLSPFVDAGAMAGAGRA